MKSLLLNEACEKLEGIIDTLHAPLVGQEKKPRTYRQKARKAYLSVSKQRRAGGNVIRKAVGQQLRYVRRNLQIVEPQVWTWAYSSSSSCYERDRDFTTVPGHEPRANAESSFCLLGKLSIFRIRGMSPAKLWHVRIVQQTLIKLD